MVRRLVGVVVVVSVEVPVEKRDESILPSFEFDETWENSNREKISSIPSEMSLLIAHTDLGYHGKRRTCKPNRLPPSNPRRSRQSFRSQTSPP